jgi:hypothetical protein
LAVGLLIAAPLHLQRTEDGADGAPGVWQVGNHKMHRRTRTLAAVPLQAAQLAGEGGGLPGPPLGDIKEAAKQFGRFVAGQVATVERHWQAALAGKADMGIVCAAGDPGALAGAFASLHVLRHHLRSELPATIVYWGRDAAPTAAAMEFMQVTGSSEQRLGC